VARGGKAGTSRRSRRRRRRLKGTCTFLNFLFCGKKVPVPIFRVSIMVSAGADRYIHIAILECNGIEEAERMTESNNRYFESWLLLVPILFGTIFIAACASDTVEQQRQTEVVLAENEEEAWDATAAFLAGVFTVANAESINSSVFLENFRANYDWIKNIFLPHLLGTSEHPWWECDEYCVKTAKLLAKGDKKREKELRESLARYKLHERERPKSK
jgi:hypothetical protein